MPPYGKVLLVAFYHGPVTADVGQAVRRNITIYTERGEGGTSVGRALACSPLAGSPPSHSSRTGSRWPACTRRSTCWSGEPAIR